MGSSQNAISPYHTDVGEISRALMFSRQYLRHGCFHVRAALYHGWKLLLGTDVFVPALHNHLVVLTL